MPVRFDLLTLKLFIAVVEEQSIARAAERENIVPSAVSKRISDLEADLKVSLIQRHNRGIATTPAGNALLLEANLGVALIPHSIAEQHARNLDVVELALNEPWAWRSLKLGVRDASALTIAAR